MRALGLAVLLTVVVWEMPAAAHHSNPMYFDTTRAITLEGKVQRVQWINPHILMFLESKNEKGEMETWILQGRSLNSAMSQVGLRERLQPGISIAARVFPSRTPLYVNDAQTVLLTKPDDPRKSSHIVGGGQSGSPTAMS